MSSRAPLETKKRTATNWLATRDLKPVWRPFLALRESSPEDFDREFAGRTDPAITNHDFSRIPVQAKSPGLRSQSDFCPLPARGGPRACPFGGACHTCPARLQPKLAKSQKGDSYEREADLFAEYALTRIQAGPEQHEPHPVTIFARTSAGPDPFPGARSKPERERELDPLPFHVQEVLQTPGEPLDPATRDVMESAFGKDFGSVRVHTDAKAALSSKKEDANAYTIGHQIVFAEGQYRPDVAKGQLLLAHELTHVLQQDPGRDPSAGPSWSAADSIIFRQGQTPSPPAEKERVWGFWVTPSMCGCVPLIRKAIKSGKKAISFYKECDLPIYTTGTEVQTCFENKACGGKCVYAGETPASGCLDIPPVPADPCKKILHRSTWYIHEVFHQRQGDRIARGLGPDFWREWKKLDGNCDRLDILSKNFPTEVAAFNAKWNEARAWVRDETESYSREDQFLHDVLRALERICVT